MYEKALDALLDATYVYSDSIGLGARQLLSFTTDFLVRSGEYTIISVDENNIQCEIQIPEHA